MSRTPNMLAARAERRAEEWRRQHPALFADELERDLRASLEAAHARQVESVCTTCGSRRINGACQLCRYS